MNRRDLLKTGASLAAGHMLLPHSAFAQAASPSFPPAGADGWFSLINGHDLTGWYTMLLNSGKGGIAEAKKMVTMEAGMLHIMGCEVNDEKYESGYIATNQEYGDVHIRVEYKWGVKTFFPRTLSKRDNGVLYGLVGTDKVWPTCMECQIEEGDVGDVFLLGGVRGIQSAHTAGLFGQGISPVSGWPKPGSPEEMALARRPRPATPNAPAPELIPPPVPSSTRMIKDGNFEDLNNWNTVDIIFQGDKSTHIVNGRSVNVATQLQQPDPKNAGQFIPLTRGKIAIEIEYSEIWFRRIEIRPLT